MQIPCLATAAADSEDNGENREHLERMVAVQKAQRKFRIRPESSVLKAGISFVLKQNYPPVVSPS